MESKKTKYIEDFLKSNKQENLEKIEARVWAKISAFDGRRFNLFKKIKLTAFPLFAIFLVVAVLLVLNVDKREANTSNPNKETIIADDLEKNDDIENTDRTEDNDTSENENEVEQNIDSGEEELDTLIEDLSVEIIAQVSVLDLEYDFSDFNLED